MSENKIEPKFFIAAKAVIKKDGKILLLRESSLYSDGANKDCFDFPGGRLKPGEHFVEVLKREVLEETGLLVKIGKPLTVGEWWPVVKGEQWQVIGVFFECESLSKDIVLSQDHNEFVWIDPKEYLNYNIIDNLKPVFVELINTGV